MMRIRMVLAVALTAAVVIAAACGGGNGAQSVEIDFTTNPDPVATGENTFEVVLTQDSTPVTDAAVTAEFFMPAMPSMNMPEMRTKADLAHQGNGVYRGSGQIMMAGDWETTVTATRGGQEIASRKLTVTAR
jgi:hypothetical protein